MVTQIAVLEAEVNRCFGLHPDADIITSQPGLGAVLGARVLAEFGDAKDRFADAKARRNYAGTSPVTKASGTRRVVLARYARNRRLADALHQQAFAALTLPRPAPAPSTTIIAPAAPTTTKPSAPCPTASSASSTAAYPTARTTTKPPPGLTAPPPPLLDKLEPWDI
jgi:transposase IS116/IS110/IS902 family protein